MTYFFGATLERHAVVVADRRIVWSGAAETYTDDRVKIRRLNRSTFMVAAGLGVFNDGPLLRAMRETVGAKPLDVGEAPVHFASVPGRVVREHAATMRRVVRTLEESGTDATRVAENIPSFLLAGIDRHGEPFVLLFDEMHGYGPFGGGRFMAVGLPLRGTREKVRAGTLAFQAFGSLMERIKAEKDEGARLRMVRQGSRT